MHRTLSFALGISLGAATMASPRNLAAQNNTVPHWSTYFGGSGREEGVVVRRGPGRYVTLVGHTTSTNLATAGAFRSVMTGPVGDTDGFVAQFDPAQPLGQQLRWCSYIGGSGLELVFDAEVDPITGATTVVGLSQSTDFKPPMGQPFPVLNGASDGFIIQLDANGTQATFAAFYGGSGADRVCEIELDGTLQGVIAGVTESTDLPAGTNSYNGGATDAFVARLVLTSPPAVQWTTYLGGDNTEGMTLAAWLLGNLWEGNLDRMALCLGAGGSAVVATASFFAGVPAWISPNAIQNTMAGAGEVYFVVVGPTGVPTYGTFYGGEQNERPKAIARHPKGGFVVGGNTASVALPLTQGCFQSAQSGAGDGYVAWIDPVLGTNGLRYATYFGGSTGEDNVLAVACESSGLITLAGYSAGGSVPVTPRSLQDTSGSNQTFGFVARLAPTGLGPNDQLYGSLACPPHSGTNTMFLSLVLDDLGDAWIAGSTGSFQYHVRNQYQTYAGVRDSVLTHLPILPGPACVARAQLGLAVPCTGAPPRPLYTGMALAPLPGTTFGITATNAPPSAPGVMVLGGPSPPLAIFNASLVVQPAVMLVLGSDPCGYARQDIPVPAGLPPVACWGLGAQWLFLTNAACQGPGPLATSDRLDF